jgi:Tfp pilus assembly protein PilN
MRIEINLLGGQRRKKAAGGGFSFAQLAEFGKQVKDPWLLGTVGAWVVAVLVIAVLFVSQTARLSSAEDTAQQTRTEARRYQNMIAQKKRAERLRDSLVTELDAIRAIDATRYVWPHLLEEVTKALPDYTWLVGVTVLSGTAAQADTTGPEVVRVQIEGRTSEIAGYTRFIRQLQASPWIGEVVPGPTTTVVEDEKALTAFSITATFHQADSTYIRTVPVSESVR